MRVLFVVHGVVQGVGYRYLAKYIADRNSVKGFVKNMEDGSVQVLADADPGAIEKFRKELQIDMKNGPQVFKIETDENGLRQFEKKKYDSFVIEKD